MVAGSFRFVFDENLIRLARAVKLLRPDVTWIGSQDMADVLPTGIADSERIPVIGARQWVMITDDKRVRTRPYEAHQAIGHHLKVIHLHGVGNQSPWSHAVLLLSRWHSIEGRMAEQTDGPWWLSARRSGVRAFGYELGAIR